MSQVSNISAVRSAIVAVGFLGLVAVGITARDAAPSGVPLGAADDYGTRHPAIAEAADDAPTGMRHGKLVFAPALGLADDFGTRQAAAAAPAQLSTADDYGTRHQVQAAALGPNDDYGTRNAR